MNRQTNFVIFSAIILLTALVHAPARAQLARNDRAFLKEATGLTRFQDEASRLATSRGGNTRVKAYASSILQRHSASQLPSLARSRGVTAPLMESGHRKTLNELSRARGSAFDGIYLQKVALGAQREEITLLERAEPGLRDPAIRAWAQDMLPRVREQLAQVPRTNARTLAPVTSDAVKTGNNARLVATP